MLRILLCCLLSIGPLMAAAEEAPDGVAGAMTVNVFQAKRLHELGAVFVDVRPGREWAWGHVAGAVHLELAREFLGLSHPQWPRAVPLVVYCDSDVCPASAEAVRLVVGWGYQQVFYFRQGYFAWLLQDFPLEKGSISRVSTLSAQVP